ncbi:hypothetical protein BCU94_14150 [Shewanella sp. 10N.286.52.C2]|nr:hypothetical protein BCU94_14150 [Shewanella sp. 10N.286.52.C2]
MGFGVDENTALLVNIADKHVSVIGEHGVWVIEQTQVTNDSNDQPISEGVSHYLTSGSQADIDDKQQLIHIELANEGVSIDMQATYPTYHQWIKQACREGKASRKQLNNYELVLLPSSITDCQKILKNQLSYQSITLRLRMLGSSL